jgi:hypothetical protein
MVFGLFYLVMLRPHRRGSECVDHDQHTSSFGPSIRLTARGPARGTGRKPARLSSGYH